MQKTVSSPTSAPRPFSVVPAPGASLIAAGRPGARPPLDVRQTCVLMFLAASTYVLLAVQVWSGLREGVPESVTVDLWTLLVVASLVAVVLAGLAVPVRRATYVLWRSAQCGAVVALVVALGALNLAAKLASTQLLLVAALVALAAIVVNIALWSTEVRRWCDIPVGAVTSDTDTDPTGQDAHTGRSPSASVSL